jgi:hypothetical protein
MVQKWWQKCSSRRTGSAAIATAESLTRPADLGRIGARVQDLPVAEWAVERDLELESRVPRA